MKATEFTDPITTVPVSVVIPCYRHAETLDRAIASVAVQSVRPIELIVVNDGGGKWVDDILQKLQLKFGADWLLIVSLPENVGAGEARNAGWQIARGEFVAFLDADDAWHPRKIEIQYDYMKTHPDVAVSGHRNRRGDTNACWDSYELYGPNVDIKLGQLLRANQFITPSVMLKRDLAIRFAAKQRHMEDFQLWLTISAKGWRIVKLGSELACVYKFPYGESGLSAQLMRMEIGELRAYLNICRVKPLLLPGMLLLMPYSLGKFLRRLFLVQWRIIAPQRNSDKLIVK